MKRLKIENITIGFAGMYANLYLSDGSKKEVKADWYKDNNPDIRDSVDMEEDGSITLVKWYDE